MKTEHFSDNIDYSGFINSIVRKRSNRPFSNGKKEDLVVGITINEYSKKQAFLFKESLPVDCFMCVKV